MLLKIMCYSEIIHNFATQKHKVIEEYLKLSCPDGYSFWIFLERHPQSFAHFLQLHARTDATSYLSTGLHN